MCALIHNNSSECNIQKKKKKVEDPIRILTYTCVEVAGCAHVWSS